jgi:ATP-dependent protease HslVU (ClpYQ) peptidase subunit
VAPTVTVVSSRAPGRRVLALHARGALRVLYGELGDAREIAERAVRVGIGFDVYCGGRIDVAEIP